MLYNYFCFEGPDFCGKTSIMSNVFPKLFEVNPSMFMLTKEPGSPYSPLCTKIRDILQNTEIKDEIVYAGLFDLDRREHLKEIIAPAIKNKKIVISDRCILSSICYQENEVSELRNFNHDFFIGLKPYIFLITTDKETLIRRSNLRKELKTIEKNVFNIRMDNILKRYNSEILNYDHDIIYNNDCNENDFQRLIDSIVTRIVYLSTGILP